MKSPEYIAHGTSSEEDASKIDEEGFVYKEGRANVSADLIYAFRWATETERRKGSQSESNVEEGETGRIVIMKVPEDKSVDYSRHTEIEIDDDSKEITGYSAKWESGRRQLAIYPATGEIIKNREGKISKEDILMSLVPTPELGEKLEEMREEIKKLHKIDLEKITEEISKIIENDKSNILAPNLNVREVVNNILVTTLEAEIVNIIRSLSLDVKRALDYKIYNRGEEVKKEDTPDKERLKNKLETALTIVQAENFDIGAENLNRYIKASVEKLFKELE